MLHTEQSFNVTYFMYLAKLLTLPNSRNFSVLTTLTKLFFRKSTQAPISLEANATIGSDQRTRPCGRLPFSLS